MDPIGQNAFKQSLVGSYSSGATSIELASISNTAGNADYLPDPASGEYNVIFYNTAYGDPASARNNSAYMIGRATAVDYGTNTLTITTAQESTSDVAMDSTWAMLYGATAKWFSEIRAKAKDIIVPDANKDGSTDDTTIIQNAIDNATSSQIVVLTPGVYAVSELSLTCNFHMLEGAQLKFTGTDNTYAIKIDAAVDVGSIYVDGNLSNCGGVSIPTAGVNVDHISVEGIRAGASYSLSLGGVVITADDVRVGSIHLSNNENDGHTNESRPPGIRVETASTESTYIGRIFQNDGASGLLTSATSGETTVDYIRVEGASDNGIYQLGGTLDVGTFIYRGDEEGIVVGGDLSVDKCIFYGGGAWAVSLNGGTRLKIGDIQLRMDGTSVLTGIIRSRSATGFGGIFIGSISGRMRGTKIFGISENAVDSLTINSSDIIYEYDAGVTAVISRWVDIESVNRISIIDFNVQIIDINNVLTTETFTVRLNSSLTKPSKLYGPIIKIYDSDETTESSATYTVSSNNQTNLDYKIYKENVEDTYEATLTPSGSGTVTLNASENLLAYSKQRKQAFITGRIKVDSISSPTGHLLLNLPFNVDDLSEIAAWGGATVWRYNGSTWVSHFIQTVEGASNAQIRMDASTVSSGDLFYFSFTYLTNE